MMSIKIESLKNKLRRKTSPSLGIYIHIPFCRVRCKFCSFYVQIYQKENVQAFLKGLHREMQIYGQEIGLKTIPVTSIYFGGGTPTVLSANQLTQALRKLNKCFMVSSDVEVSIEAHPGTISPNDLKVLHSGGFNRLSVGAQSFNDNELRQLSGRSASKDSKIAVESARKTGLENINLDLMYGFPGHSIEAWKKTLKSTISLKPTHLSCYAFTVEENSQFHSQVNNGIVSQPDEALQFRLGVFAKEFLEGVGYEQYEISNFCKPGFACQHNLRYWQGDSYLGFGPSAQSFVSGVRFGNKPELKNYCRTLGDDELPIDQLELLNAQEIQRDRVVFGLRTMRGVPLEQVKALSQLDFEWEKRFKVLKKKGFLSTEQGCVRLTDKGMKFADMVSGNLF